MRDDVRRGCVVGQHRLLVGRVVSRCGSVLAHCLVVAHIGGWSLDLVHVGRHSLFR